MFGTRGASKCLGKTVIEVLTTAGCEAAQVVPMTFRHETHGYFTTCLTTSLPSGRSRSGTSERERCGVV